MKTKRQVKRLFLVAFVVSGLAFRCRAAFGRSDRNWNSGNWDCRTGCQLRLSAFRIRVLSPRGVLLPATRLWYVRKTVIRFVSRASSVFPSPPLSSE